MKWLVGWLALCAAAASIWALAGPPFDTDHPVPTDYRNYEIYSGATTHQDNGVGTAELPLWAQKMVGRVTIFGGGGFDFNRDVTGNGDWQAGLAATYPLRPDDTIGMEFTRTTPHDDYSQSDIGVGDIHPLGAAHALLFSAGRTYGTQPHYRGYAAYGWFLGPANSPKS